MKQTKRAEITVHGDVQRTGYRYLVQETARKLGVQGYVKNMPDGTVKITVEAPKEIIERFIRAIKIKEPPIDAQRIEPKHLKPTGEFKFFTIKYGELTEEMAEGFGTGLKYINLSRAETKEGFNTLRSEMKEGFGTLRSEMKEGFQTVGKELREMREDINKNFQEMSTKYDIISKDLAGAIKIIQEESIKTRNELTRAVDSLSKLVEEFIKERRRRERN